MFEKHVVNEAKWKDIQNLYELENETNWKMAPKLTDSHISHK